MGHQERKLLNPIENICYTFSVSYLAKARKINNQLQLDQKLGLSSEEEKEIFKLYLAERLLRNELNLAITDPNNLRFPKRPGFLVEGMSFIGEKAGKVKEQVNSKRARTIYGAVNDLKTQIKDENYEEEALTLWKDKWAPQLASNTSHLCQNLV